ncbi:RHS repeat-associated core domain-containing protein [Robiginitomaculum antarcticum]|uniref:RHS repeat-associated core domain-containing protein n=1 Tax=Robiginitomaculum antarcticum TaxID=437507 RepID=UPI00036DDD14|nr:RHS repeat-associated core domain-containing protein [Robiginitomaculum antarcticum]
MTSYSKGMGYTTGCTAPSETRKVDLTSKTLGSRTVQMEYDALNRLSQFRDSAEGGNAWQWVGYDARGNVTDNGTSTLGGLTFTYDMSDQPTAITDAVNGTFKYDGNLKRVKSVMNGETIYNIYDSSGFVSMVDPLSSSSQFIYIRLGGQVSARIYRTPSDIAPPQINYTHTDHLGSPVAGTDSAGNVAWRERYTPYGEKLLNPAALDNQAAFTGHIYDAPTGLTYMQARYYDPNIGRFLSIDPVNVTPSTPGMFNRYAYVYNDPINIIDPTGMYGCSDTGAQGLSGTCFDSSNFRTEDKKGFFGTSKANDFSGDAVGTASTDSAATSFASSTNQKTGNEQVSRIDTNPDGTSTTSNVPLTSSSSSSAAFKPSEVAGADGVVHTHPTNKNTPVPGAGDSQVPEMGIPNYIAHGSNTVIAVEISGGQVRGRVVSGKLGSTDRKALRSRLNQFQRRGETR